MRLLDSAETGPQDICAIGSHGQTVRHSPPAGGNGFTLQIGDPNTIAERTGIATIADFRRRDMASGGQGAPLAPAFHAAAFARAGVDRAIVNIGGIANATLLAGEQLAAGFDTGPGNTLLDHWFAHHREGRFDRDGAWAASGESALGPDWQAPDDAEGGEVVARIKHILEQEIRPYVAMDGGEISFAGYRDGVVEVYLQGACAGCPSSTITLKMGIESRLREEIPEVSEVVAL